MGSLMKQTPYSEITATLEVLDALGVKRDDLWRLRRDGALAELVARQLRTASILSQSTSRLIKTLTVTCYGNATASQLREQGKYDRPNDITDELFPIPPHAPVTNRLELFGFDCDPLWVDVLAVLVTRNLDWPTAEHGLYLGIQHPKEQRAHHVVIPHQPVLDSRGYASVLVLVGSVCGRGLQLNCCDGRWHRDDVFVGVRLSASPRKAGRCGARK